MVHHFSSREEEEDYARDCKEAYEYRRDLEAEEYRLMIAEEQEEVDKLHAAIAAGGSSERGGVELGQEVESLTQSMAGTFVGTPTSTVVDFGSFLSQYALDGVPCGVKVWCVVCCCMVNPVDHGLRCREKSIPQTNSARTATRAASWAGQALHEADVRVYVVTFLGLVVEQWQSAAQPFLSQDHRASWYASYEGSKSPALGGSVVNRAMAFNASYFGIFRQKYVEDKLGGSAPPAIYFVPFNEESFLLQNSSSG